jgi:hypothetical protein
MEAILSSETLIHIRNTRCYISEGEKCIDVRTSNPKYGRLPDFEPVNIAEYFADRASRVYRHRATQIIIYMLTHIIGI